MSSEKPETMTTGSISTGEEVDQLRGLLGVLLRVEIVDGRVFEGIFVCLDKPLNLVLDNAIESIPPTHPPREVGIILIPIRHIIRVLAPSQSITKPFPPGSPSFISRKHKSRITLAIVLRLIGLLSPSFSRRMKPEQLFIRWTTSNNSHTFHNSSNFILSEVIKSS
ncbi:hypothetical protein KEM48_008441 [Puccinia striiformis f. sp. tritici PST-130]|nr:hypothetical protein KEM48_008441 [Puccinia striiformis f. sp. tritici PST-130]